MKIQKNGFTLTEVASVTALAAVVAALAYPMINTVVARTEFAAAKLALSSLHRKCEAINMLGVSGVENMVNIRGYKIKSSNGAGTKDMSKLCKSTAVVFISDREARPSLYYGLAKGSSGCLVSSKHINNYPECSAKEQTTLAEALNKNGSLMKSKADDYYSFSSSAGGDRGQTAGSGGKCDKDIDPTCS